MQPKITLLGGIVIYIYGLEHVRYVGNRSPVVIFVTHGRNGSAHDIMHVCHALIERDYRRGSLLCVAVDQRNHGRRLVDEQKNASWSANPDYPIDIYSMLYGTAVDLSLLADLLPIYLNMSITTFGAIGVAMGGYTALLTMTRDARFILGISLIGFTSYLDLLENKAKMRNKTTAYLKDCQRAQIAAREPIEKISRFHNRSLLFVFGGKDRAIPMSCSQAFLEQLKQHDKSTPPRDAGTEPTEVKGHVSASFSPDIYVEEASGHELTLTMITHAAEWLHRWVRALSTAGGAQGKPEPENSNGSSSSGEKE